MVRDNEPAFGPVRLFPRQGMGTQILWPFFFARSPRESGQTKRMGANEKERAHRRNARNGKEATSQKKPGGYLLYCRYNSV